ncbi:TolC family outer membrane protein [Sulfurimonas sp.]|uniref:TolC family outer membrane protein n=1 Tax=Sulfurimonas sp. TaxID=2022749 RepID=UPI003D0E4C07
MKKLQFIVFSVGLMCFNASAETLKEDIKNVLETNPKVVERLKNFRVVKQDMNIAESEYYPTLDFQVSGGYNDAGNFKDDVLDVQYTNYQSSLVFTQNLFNGFSTTHKVDYQQARTLAAAYNYLETADDVAFGMSGAYLEVLKSQELVQTAIENVQINESILQKVQDLFDSGLTTESEVKKIQSSLSLAKTNLIVQQNNARDKENNFKRVLGRMPNTVSMQRPKLNVNMPESYERAAMYAIQNNPSILVSRYNVQSAQELWKQSKNGYYPTLDLQVTQNYDDVSKNNNTFDRPDDRFQAQLLLNYNLYKGGADEAEIQKNISKINQEIEIKRDKQRDVIESLELSWNAYEMIQKQLVELKEYSKFSEKTLDLYKEEYDLGRRSLLDLLSAQNDVINSRKQIISAEYDYLYAQYRILDAMGLLTTVVLGDTDEYRSKVSLAKENNEGDIEDVLPVKLDSDNDKLEDSVDLCDNSLLENNIMPYGCKRIEKDTDADGVFDSKDECPYTLKDVKVDLKGCALDSDSDGVSDNFDECPNTPLGYDVDNKGCAIATTLRVNFQYKSTQIPQNAQVEVERLANFIKEKKNYTVHIVGHTDSVASKSYNQRLSEKRALGVKNALVKLGVNPAILSYEGKGETAPIADNSTPEGAFLNRRVEVQLNRE